MHTGRFFVIFILCVLIINAFQKKEDDEQAYRQEAGFQSQKELRLQNLPIQQIQSQSFA